MTQGSKCLLQAGQGPACLRSLCGQGRLLTSHPDFDKHHLIAEPRQDVGQSPRVLQAVGSKLPSPTFLIFPPLPTGGAGGGERPGGLILPGEVPPRPEAGGPTCLLRSSHSWSTDEDLEDQRGGGTYSKPHSLYGQSRDSALCSPVLWGPKRGVRASVSPPYSGGDVHTPQSPPAAKTAAQKP